jgi:Na+/H+ antiporter NhaD/arsenite permease-like protein
MHALSEGWRTVLTCLVGVLTLVGIMTRPFRLNEATVALAGAAILLLFVTPTCGRATDSCFRRSEIHSFSFWE